MSPDDEDFARPNLLAITSVVVGMLTLVGQALGLCFWICAPMVLAVPTIVTLGAAWLGWRQAEKTNGQGRELAIIGMVLGLINLAIDLFWVGIALLYFGVMAVAMLLGG